MQANNLWLSARNVVSGGMAKHVGIVLLLFVAFMLNFFSLTSTAPGDALGPGDEPAYVHGAQDYWAGGTMSDLRPMTWSPGYAAMMSPFVGLLGKEAGYKAWRFVLFLGLSVMTYVAFYRMFGSAWIGAVLAIYVQTLWLPYYSPSLQSLMGLVLLICFTLLARGPKYLGLVFAILVNSILVSGVASSALTVFAILCLVFFRREVFSVRFFTQLGLGIALFIATAVGHFKYDLSTYPEDAVQRGRSGLYHQIELQIFDSGRSEPYYREGDYDPKDGPPSEYIRHLKAIQRYFQAKFGDTSLNLRFVHQENSGPAFLLNWPWLIEKDPELMKDYARDNVRVFREGAWMAFEPLDPHKFTSNPDREKYDMMIWAFLPLILMLPWLMKLAMRRPLNLDRLTRPSRLLMLFALSCLAILVPLMLVKPFYLYFPPLIPLYMLAVALLARTFLHKALPV